MRLLDANFNRAREALRVVEDYARFVLNDRRLAGLAKQMRHDLCGAMGGLQIGELLAARDTPGDVGTSISTAAEVQRADAAAVATAAGKRLTEALRCLEEYSKIENPNVAQMIEAIRYRAYDLEQQVAWRGNLDERLAGVRLYVLLTVELCRGGVVEAAEQVLAGGADCVQLRAKGRSDVEVLGWARAVSELCRQGQAMFVMNDRVDLAVLADADGVHLGQDDVTVRQGRRLVGGDMVIGKSTHSIAEAEGALADGADYIGVGSVFGSKTKPQVARSGVELVKEVAQICDRPIIALGGITADNAGQVIEAGATGVAVCEAVLGAAEPERAAREIRQAVLAVRGG